MKLFLQLIIWVLVIFSSNVFANENTFSLPEGGTLWAYCSEQQGNDVPKCAREIMYANREWFAQRGVVWHSITDVEFKEAKKLRPGSYALPTNFDKVVNVESKVTQPSLDVGGMQNVGGAETVVLAPKIDFTAVWKPRATAQAVLIPIKDAKADIEVVPGPRDTHASQNSVSDTPEAARRGVPIEQEQSVVSSEQDKGVTLIPAPEPAVDTSPKVVPQNVQHEKVALETDCVASGELDGLVLGMNDVSNRVKKAQETLSAIFGGLVIVLITIVFAGLAWFFRGMYLHRRSMRILHAKIKEKSDDSEFHRIMLAQTQKAVEQAKDELGKLKCAIAPRRTLHVEDAGGVLWEVEVPVSHLRCIIKDDGVQYVPMFEREGTFVTLEELEEEHKNNNRS